MNRLLHVINFGDLKMALAKFRTIRKDQKRSLGLTETSKVLKLLKGQATSVNMIYAGKHITLVEVDGMIEIQEAHDQFQAQVAEYLVTRFQGLYDDLKAKLSIVAAQ